MKHLQVSSVPILNMLQTACELLIFRNQDELDFINTIEKLEENKAETKLAEEMLDHLRELIKSNESEF